MSEMSSGMLAVGVAIAVALSAMLFASGAAERAGAAFIPSSSQNRAEVWAVGDGADGSAEGMAVAKMIARAEADRFLYLGDVYPRGTAADFATNYQSTYGRLAPITAPTMGNHEADNRDVGYDPYWRAVHGQTPPDYYAFRIAGWKIISLNSEADHEQGSQQVRWLRRKASGPGDCRIAFWHRPRFNAGMSHPGGDEGIASLWNALQGQARLVLNGHEHSMQRQAPRQGIVQLISGAGGNESDAGIDRDYPGLRFGNATSYGALRLRLTRHRARFAFVTTDGRVLDSGTRRCKRKG
jgi:hypothetical protein